MRREDFEHVLAAAAEVTGHDALVVGKCAAGRERDWEYAGEALKAGLVDADVLLVRVPDLPMPAQTRDHIEKMLRSIIDRQRQ